GLRPSPAKPAPPSRLPRFARPARRRPPYAAPPVATTSCTLRRLVLPRDGEAVPEPQHGKHDCGHGKGDDAEPETLQCGREPRRRHVSAAVHDRVDEALRLVTLLPIHVGEEDLPRRSLDSVMRGPADALNGHEDEQR